MLSEFENKIFTWMAEHIKLFKLSKTLNDNFEQTNALIGSTEALVKLTNEAVKLGNDDVIKADKFNIIAEVLGYDGELKGLTDNSILSFDALSEELKRNKKFLLLALMSGVDGRLLTYASPFVMFMDEPQGEQQVDEWYKTAEFDNDFFSLAAGLNEHSFYGLWSNPKIESMVADGYEKFDLWENESAWVSTGKNPRFLRYHDDLSLELVMEEWAGSEVERTLKDTIRKVSSDLPGFARSILPDYFNLMDLKQVEKQFNLRFDDSYLEMIRKNDEQMPALHSHEQSEEIYNCTDLSDFEAIVRFIVSHEK